jgi:mannose-6-phosphate isomerase-like protein (cupin superfamily)
MYVLPEPSTTSFEKVGIQGKIFPSQELISSSEFVVVSTETGHETTIIEHESDFMYYILQGEGIFEIDGNSEKCATGNLVVVPAGNKFSYKGKLKMLLAVTPPWREEQEETL